MKVTAITPKPAKFATNDVKTNLMPSTSRSPLTAIVTSWTSNSPSSGYAPAPMMVPAVSS